MMIYSKEKFEKLAKRWSAPKGKTLLKTIKESRCYLSIDSFREIVKNFPFTGDPEIKNSIDLRGAPLSGFDFRTSIQQDDEGFFEEIALLSNIHFEGATLKHCNFEEGKIHDCFFDQSNLAHSDFKNTTLNNCTFENTETTGVNLQNSKLINCNFINAELKDIILDSTIVDEKTTFGKILKSEQEKNYRFASIEYKQIKEMYKNSNLYNFADKFHYKEMVAKRKTAPLVNPKRWLNYIFGDLLCKYGTSFGRVFIWSIIVIFFCAMLANTTETLLYNNQKITSSFLDALYFSLVSFTTLGYGDFHAIGFMRFVAGAESFIGATFMALFAVIAGRRIIRD